MCHRMSAWRWEITIMISRCCRLVGHPIAMENAVPAVKTVCERETDMVEHILEEVLSGI